MALQVVEHELTTTASPATVYALLIDGSTWPEWSPIGSFELISPGDGSPEGVGAVRVFHTGRIHSKERVVLAQPNQAFAYELVSGLAIRDYRAVVTLRPSNDGTPHPLALHLQTQGPGHGLDLSAPAQCVHRPHRERPGRVGFDLRVPSELSRADSANSGLSWPRSRPPPVRRLRAARRPAGAGRAPRTARVRPPPGDLLAR